MSALYGIAAVVVGLIGCFYTAAIALDREHSPSAVAAALLISLSFFAFITILLAEAAVRW